MLLPRKGLGRPMSLGVLQQVGLRAALSRRHSVTRVVASIPSLSLGSAASRVGICSGQAGSPWEEKHGGRCIPFWPNEGVRLAS